MLIYVCILYVLYVSEKERKAERAGKYGLALSKSRSEAMCYEKNSKRRKRIPHKLSLKNKDDRINLLNKQNRTSFLWKLVTGD